MEVKKKGNKGIIVLVVVLIILLLGAVGYICYDKGVFDGLLGKDKTVESKGEKKLSEEEVKKLHDSLITTSKQFGFYFERKVSVDEIPADLMLQYAMSNYLDENNIKYDTDNYYRVCGDYSEEYYFCDIDDESEKPKEINNDITKKMTISKTTIDNYIKEHFNTSRNFVFNEQFFVQTTNNSGLDVYYNSKKEEYYIIIPHRGGSTNAVDSKYIRFEQNDDELYIYDKVVICSIENGGGCNNMFYVSPAEYSNDNKSLLFFWNNLNDVRDKNDKKINDGAKYIGKFNENKKNFDFNYDLIYQDFDSELNTYKHTFKKASDGKYYWYSSEIVNE